MHTIERPIFKNTLLEETFRKSGYVVVDFMNSEEVQQVEAIVDSLREERLEIDVNIEASYKLSFFVDNPEYRKRVFDRISDFCQPLLDAYLNDYEPLMVNTFDKEPGSGEVPVHQNWTFVDEERYRSVSIWIPLVDVTRENGTMELVPGSHLGVSLFRGPLIPWVFSDIVDTIKQKYMVPLNLKVGQAAIIDDAILHYTSQNDTETIRATVQIIAKPQEASAIHYHRPSEDSQHLEVFEINSDFFQRFKMYSTPEGVPKLAEIPFVPFSLNEEQFKAAIDT